MLQNKHRLFLQLSLHNNIPNLITVSSTCLSRNVHTKSTINNPLFLTTNNGKDTYQNNAKYKPLFTSDKRLSSEKTFKRFYTNRNLMSLKERGLVSNVFPSDNPQKFINFCNARPQTVYAGFDPTADSLHVGNLAVIMMLLHSLRAGHKVIALIGGATGMIGDPSGKNAERSALENETVIRNGSKIMRNLQSVFLNHEQYFWDSQKGTEPLAAPILLNNYDWYKEISSIDFVGRIGRHFRMGMMLMKDSVKGRLSSDEGMSFTEFTYQIFQAYDWLHLLEKHDCYVQVGGHDQMGNILAGHELISRALKKQVYGLTVPLVTTEQGNKYGKTAGNAIWLDEERTSSFEMYQFFMRAKDTDLEKLLRIFTFKQEQEIEAILSKHQKSPEKHIGQKELAKNVTTLVHGEEGLKRALQATEALYSENIEALASLRVDDIHKIFKGASKSGNILAEIYLEPGTTILDMAVKAKCFESEKDAMRIIEAGGFFLNYRKISNFEEMIVPGIHILPNKISLARVGKKNYYVIKWNP